MDPEITVQNNEMVKACIRHALELGTVDPWCMVLDLEYKAARSMFRHFVAATQGKEAAQKAMKEVPQQVRQARRLKKSMVAVSYVSRDLVEKFVAEEAVKAMEAQRTPARAPVLLVWKKMSYQMVDF